METDLSVLVDAIAAANVKAGLGQQRRPWLEPLPEIVTLGELPAPAPGRAADIAPIPYGLTDLPHRQAREPLTLDFPSAQHTVIAGAARSGRSSLLRTLAGAVAARTSPGDVHIYGIDCGAGALLPVSELPHCGAVVAREQVDRVERLLSKLRNEIARRQQLLAAQGFAGLAEQRAATSGEERLPWMLLLLDWWEGYYAAFGEYDMGRLVETLLQVLREGSAVGLRAVVTTDRAAMLGQIGTVFGHRMIFRLTDRSDCSLAEIRERALPAHQPDGRLMFGAKPNPLEAQVALLDPDPTGLAQVGALRQIAAEARQRYGEAAARGTARCGSTRSRHGSPWPRPTGSTRTSRRRRGCGRWPARAGTSCRRRAWTWPRKGRAWWWRARHAAGGRPRSSRWPGRCSPSRRRCC